MDPQLERKIRSFSEHSGLGKTYHRYELINTSNREYMSSGPGEKLPKEIRFRMTEGWKTELIYLTVLTCICLLIIKAAEGTWTLNLRFLYIGSVWFILMIGGFGVIGSAERKYILNVVLNDDRIKFNKQVFPHTVVETTFIKKDLDRKNKLKHLWILVVMKNGDMYEYEIPKRYSWIRIKGRYKLEELLYHYRENRQFSAKLNPPGPKETFIKFDHGY